MINRIVKIFAVMAAMVVAAVSCNKENVEVAGKMATLSYSVSVNDVATKAIGDGTTVDKLACAVYDGADLYKKATVAKADGSFTYAPSLYYGKTYTVVFFAYKEGAYNVEDLTKITRNGNGEVADAFTYMETVKINADGTLTVNNEAKKENVDNHTVKLTRPFAQLNIGTESLDDLTEVGVTKVQVSFSNAESYSALAKKYDGQTEVEYTSNIEASSSDTFTIGEALYNLVSLNYLFATGNVILTIKLLKVTTDANGQDTEELIRTITLDNVPLVANQRTNIYGNLVKGELKFNVSVNAGFATDQNGNEI